MGAFGDSLRRERELRGVTLAEISESTKISKRWLQALEDEEFELLPGGVFNRGFVRAYAHFLGINEEQAVADYVVASNEQQPPEDRFPLEIHEKPDSPKMKPRRSLVPLLLAVLALVLLVSGWTFWMKHKITAQSASVAHANSQSVDSQPSPAAPQAVQPAVAPVDSSSQQSAAGGEKTQPSQDLSGSFSVVIKATKSSWISIAADGKTIWEGTLDADDEREVTANKQLVLKTGNAAGTEVSYNGKTLGALGKDNEVRVLTFNTAGLQQ